MPRGTSFRRSAANGLGNASSLVARNDPDFCNEIREIPPSGGIGAATKLPCRRLSGNALKLGSADDLRRGVMWTRREGIKLAITALAAAWTNSTTQAQAPATASPLAPTGKLRAALIVSNPVLVTRRPDGTLAGVSLAVAKALAVHLGVPIQLKPYDNPARYNDSLATDDWDVGLAARDPTRADHLAFSTPFMEVDNGYVARPNAAPTSAEEVDKPGVKIAVAQGSAPHNVLQRLIKNAQIIPVPGGFEPAREALAAGTADVYGENLHLAHRIADVLPGARVLPGRFNVVQMAIGVRKRAESALSSVDEFVNKIRSDGTVQKAINEAGLRGVRVP